jgi:hypothetical protein
MNEPVRVETFERAGARWPQAFHWRGRRYDIEHHGRQWEERDGRHYLVMTVDRRPFELAERRVDGTWRLVRAPSDFDHRPPVM